jgi:hypothetical protein
VVDAICDRMVNGDGLLKILRDEGMPSRTTVYRWLQNNPDFAKRFTRAREALMDFYAEQILTIAFDESGDVILDQVGDKTKAVANHAKVQRDKLKVNTLQWVASRLFPKRYGDKMELLAQTDEPKDMTIRWEVERTIVEPKVSDLMAAIDGKTRSAYSEGKTEADQPTPRQITFQPTPPPADLSPEAWVRMSRVSDLIDQIAPSDEMPEAVFGIIEAALRRHYLGQQDEPAEHTVKWDVQRPIVEASHAD